MLLLNEKICHISNFKMLIKKNTPSKYINLDVQLINDVIDDEESVLTNNLLKNKR